ncbi:MAG: methionine gamma-lyase family protein [bacterium]|nr:methionine gamma-lyase family protein [bacterium]
MREFIAVLLADSTTPYHPALVWAARAAAEDSATPPPGEIERDAAVRLRMLRAFVSADLTDADLAGTTGYGYGDAARDAYERLLAALFGAERALARLSLVSGTHAIVAAIAALVAPGERLLSAAGRPYDTLRNAIAQDPASLVNREGICYDEVALRDDGGVDIAALQRALAARPTRAVFVQRSRGYAPRPSLSVDDCARLIEGVRAASPQTLILVDNCYGEFVEEREPTHVGADLCLGSLIKNPGGGLAPTGGYVVGRSRYVERVATRLYAPGLGDRLGPTLGLGRLFFQGLFQAPLIVREALRGLRFAAALFARLGYAVDPAPGAVRRDIIQGIRLRDEQELVAFARGLQRTMPVNARFAPEPGSVPGYVDRVVMAGGSFIGGATLELSCDAPLRPPYDVYLQGGIMAEHTALGALGAAQALLERGR